MRLTILGRLLYILEMLNSGLHRTNLVLITILLPSISALLAPLAGIFLTVLVAEVFGGYISVYEEDWDKIKSYWKTEMHGAHKILFPILISIYFFLGKKIFEVFLLAVKSNNEKNEGI